MSTPTSWISEFQVNTGTADTPVTNNPKIIGLSNGNFLVAWVEVGTTGVGTTAGNDIIGKIYDAEGTLVRDSYRLNSTSTEDNEDGFSIAATNDGGFIMVYEENESATQSDINWQRYDAAGDSTNSLRIATENVAGDLLIPQVVVNNNDNSSYVTWQDSTVGNNDIIGVRLNSSGATLSGPFDAAQNSADYDRDHASAILSNGNLVTVYEEDDSPDQSIEFKIVNTAGTQVSNVQVTSGSSSEVRDPDIASLVNGNFVVVWENDGNIEYRVYTNTGSAVTGILQVGVGSDEVNEPQVIGLPDGGFVIAWDDDTDLRTEAHAYLANGTADGGQFTALASNGTQPDLGVTGDGRILVAHSSSSNVQARIWDPREGVIESEDYVNLPLNFVEAEVITTRAGSTTLNGDGGPDMLLGQGGNDIINGDGGNDSIRGGAGNDTIDGGFAIDTIDGGTGNDSLRGGGGNDSIFGGADDDTLQGGSGTDTLDGGTGSNTADYSYSAPLPPPALSLFSSWDINLVTGSAAFTVVGSPPSDVDTLSNIQNVIGSGWGDTITFGSGNNLIEGESGNDRLVMSFNNGVDTIDGGAGNDTFVADISWSDIVIFDMVAGEVQFNTSVLHEFTEVENLEIGGGADAVGDGSNNRITVNDTGTLVDNDIDGGGGDDTIDAGIGNDTVAGGLGDDLIIERMEAGTVTEVDGDGNNDTLDLSDASEGITATESLVTSATNLSSLNISSIEGIIGTDFADDITEDGGTFNLIEAGLGDDTVTGSANGVDSFDGGGGIDTFVEIGNSSYNYDMVTGTVDTSANTLTNFENLTLGNGNSTVLGTIGENILILGGGSDSIDANSGNDTIVDGLENGNSTIDGGGGTDALDLSTAAAGVSFVLENTGLLTASNGAILNLNNFDEIFATNESDDIYEAIGLDDIFAGGGDDTIRGDLQSGDAFHGGAGNDTYVHDNSSAENVNLETGVVDGAMNISGIENYTGNDGNDTVVGTNADANLLRGFSGDDNISGLAGDDTLEGGNGADTLNGGADNDRLVGGDDSDVLLGSVGDDALIGENGGDTLNGQGGNDTLRGGTGIDVLYGGADNDLMYGGGNSDTLEGGDGADTLIGENGSDSILGESGSDSITGGGGNDTIRGGDNNDTVRGGDNNDLIYGEDGSDSLFGDAGGDTISGGIGNDTLEGGGGADSLDGGAWSDTLSGGLGNDTLRGGDGFDSLDGGDGSDFLLGGANNDTMIGGNGNDTLNGQANADVIDGGAGTDSIIGGDGSDSINGGDDNDTISGGNNNDTISGDDGDDVIFGGNGSDEIFGNSGADTITGGAGNDRILGGIGPDDFVYAAGFGDDTIEGFTANFDDIVMQGFTAGDLTLSTGGGNTVVDVNATSDSITLLGVTLTDFSDFDFV